MNESMQTVRVKVGDDVIDAAGLVDSVRRADSGATVLFLGTVRDHSEGKTGVTHIEYEVYAEMVEPKIEETVTEACRRWPVM